MVLLNLKLEDDGFFRGNIERIYMGYDGIKQRKKVLAFSSTDDYVKDMDVKLSKLTVKNAEVENLNDFEKSVVEKLEVEMEGFDDLNREVLLFNPFMIEKWSENPFKSNERLYPVDFAAPLESIISLTLEYPETFKIENLPENMGLALPNNGGRFILNVQNPGNKLIISNSLTISKTIYSSGEYHYLKELFNRIIQVQNTDIIFKRR
jgi:hypothetical protein